MPDPSDHDDAIWAITMGGIRNVSGARPDPGGATDGSCGDAAAVRTKRPFWAYCGLALVTRVSSEWAPGDKKQWRRARTPLTRGLTTSFNHTLKQLFKGAATTVIQQAASPMGQAYAQLVANGTKPTLAKLTIARRIAAIALALWKHNEEYDPTKHRKQSL